MEKMTIHRALSELKLIDARITKQISEIEPTGIFQKGKLINGYKTPEDFNTTAKSKMDSVNDLIKRKVTIKSAIVNSNSTTKVNVGGTEMSVADAITFKGVIAFKKQLIDKLNRSHKKSVADLTNNNGVVEKNVQILLEHTFGKESTKADARDIEAIRKPYLENNEFHLADPLSVEKVIEAMEKEISTFESEVDAVLSESNAVTIIEI